MPPSVVSWRERDVPCVDLPGKAGLELRNGYEDDDGFFAAFHVDLLGGTDLEGPELVLDLGHIGLELDEGLRQLRLELGRWTCWCVCGALDFVRDGHDRGQALSVYEI